jgi:hypothetical protein
LIWNRRTSIYSQRWKKHLRLALPLQWRCSKWSQGTVMCPGCIFFCEGLDKLIKLIWDCISASWVTLYVVILFK